MAYDAARKEVGDIAARRAEAYAKKHGHQFVCVTENIIPADAQQGPYWLKVHVLERELLAGGCDWLFWLDSDAMIADMDFDIRSLVSVDKNFLCSVDYRGFCVGVFLLRNCDWSLNFMRTIKWLGYYTGYGQHNDQETFLHLIAGWRTIGTKVARISEMIVQNPATVTTSTPFVFHYWTQWNKIAEVVKRMTIIEEKGWVDSARLLNSPKG